MKSAEKENVFTKLHLRIFLRLWESTEYLKNNNSLFKTRLDEKCNMLQRPLKNNRAVRKLSKQLVMQVWYFKVPLGLLVIGTYFD